MLVLQRRKGESLQLGNDIKITIVETGTDTVKLAIDAPRDIKILRSELLEAIAENKKAAAEVPPAVLNELFKK